MAYISFQPKDYFNTKLYSGTGSSNAITGVGFQPDFVWQKSRSNGEGHGLFDVLRGVTNRIQSNTNSATSSQAGSLTAFGSDGFTVGGSPNNDAANGNGQTFASWNWKANGAGSSNTDGSINTTYTSASTTSGFSISTYTGTGSNATVGHGLGVAPKVVLIKQTNGTAWWFMYHNDLGTTGKLNLNTTGYNNDLQASYWNSTAPSSSVFSLGTEASVNGSSQNFVAYCFADVQGFSKAGSYTGNGNADGSFIYTGFSPAIIIAKKTSGTSDWIIWDNKRDGYNETLKRVYPNESAAEENSTTQGVDFLSNGFKLRGTNSNAWNASGGTYIYMAFAEEPLVSSNGVPATAR